LTFYKIATTLVLLFIFFIISCRNTLAVTNINVISYWGPYDQGSYDYKVTLDYCNAHNLIPGYTFTYTRDANTQYGMMNAAKLSGKNVVMYPGGSYLMGNSTNTDQTAVQNFVRNGGGYYGTCAGEGIALEHSPIDPTLHLLNLIPGISAIENWIDVNSGWDGILDTQLTEKGTKVFGYGGNLMKYYWRGPIAYLNNGAITDPSITDLSYYDNNHLLNTSRFSGMSWNSIYDLINSGGKYKEALTGTYGLGRVVLQHGHPELGGRDLATENSDGYFWYPKLVCAGVAYAAGYDNVLPSYTLGYDRGYYTNNSTQTYKQYLSASSSYNFISQKAAVTANGTIFSLWVLHQGTGRVIAGIYSGDTAPTTLLSQSSPVLTQSLPDHENWQKIDLQTPINVLQGQTIWLTFAFEDTGHKFYSRQYTDNNGNSFENFVWAGNWTKTGANFILPSSPTTDMPTASIKKFLVSTFTEVVFSSPTPTPTSTPTSTPTFTPSPTPTPTVTPTPTPTSTPTSTPTPIPTFTPTPTPTVTPTPSVVFWDNLDPVKESWTHQAGQGLDDWSLSTSQYYSATHSFFVSDPANIKDDYLNTRAFVVPTNGLLTFWHTYNLESTYDGAVIEISTDGGTTFADLQSNITAGSYNGQISTYYSSPISGRRAWTGGKLGTMTQVKVNLSPYVGKTAIIRFRMASDVSVSGSGWYIDDIHISGS